MSGTDTISVLSLLISSSLVMITLFFSYWQKLKLEGEIIVGVIRAVLQLIAVGYVLEFIFGYENPLFTTLLLLFMTVNAAYNAAKRGREIRNGFRISFLAILMGVLVTISILIFSKTLDYEPQKIVPVSGMIISNSMVALGLCYRQLISNFKNKRQEVESKLALGGDILNASIEIIRDSIKTGMIPTIDSAKTLGIVSLPGMMTGLILAGTPPMEAIKYQLMVAFMLLSTTSISSFIACFLSYKEFFNERKQIIS